MPNYLVISVIGPDNAEITAQLASAAEQNQCNIEQTYMSVMAGTYVLVQLVSGKWNNLAKLEGVLSSLETKLGISISSSHAEKTAASSHAFTFSVEITGIDQPGIVKRLVEFFSTREIRIQNLMTTAYTTPHNTTPMFTIHMQIDIPARIHIATVREEFLDLCDEENFDGMIEPLKI